MLGAFAAILGVVVTVLLAAAAALARALTPAAATVAAAFGIAVVLSAGFAFLGLLVVFVVVSSLATRYRFEEKARRHVQEGSAGERGVSNVLAHIVLPTAIALAGGLGLVPLTTAAILFGAALAFAASDTLASEFGVLMGTAVSIVSFRKVTAGTNGGVSTVGELFAVAGALGTAGVGAVLNAVFGPMTAKLWAFLLAVAVAGFLGCQVDSLLGETLENRGFLTKASTNFLGMLSAIGLSVALAAALGLGT